MTRGLAFTWHPPEGGTAGGFLLTRRFLELQRTFEFTLVDSDSTDIVEVPGRLTIIGIPERWLQTRSRRLFAVVRVANWLVHFVGSFVAGLRAVARAEFVYVPTSELPHVTLAAFLIAKLARRPLVLCNLNVEGVMLWGFNRILHRRATAILTISNALASELVRQFPGMPIRTFPVGTDDASVLHRADPQFDGVFVGRHVAAKGIFDLLEIWKRCCAASPDLRLALAGPCEPAVAAEIARRLAELGIASNVTLLGSISEDAKWQLYANARVCVFPSHVEGWGIVPLEAHIAGLPVVAYALDAYDEHIATSPSATLVMVGDLDAFARATLHYLATPIDVEATSRYAKRFTWERSVEAETAALSDVLGAETATCGALR